MKHLFITGCPRSGTTMLASILGNCENSVVTPESDFFLEFIGNYFPNDNCNIDKEKYYSFLRKNYRFKQWSIDEASIDSPNETISLDSFNVIIENTVKLYASNNTSVPPDSDFNRLDHTPRSILHFDVLDRLFPDAKFIFIIRDPRAVYASVKELDWGANSAMEISNLWLEYVARYYSLKAVDPNRVIMVKYEDIVTSPNKYVEKICLFAGLNFDKSILKGGGFKLPKYTKNQHVLVGKALTADRIDRWKKKVTEKDTLIIESKCNLAMSSFGYEYSKAKRYDLRHRDKIESQLKEFCLSILNKLKKKKRQRIN